MKLCEVRDYVERNYSDSMKEKEEWRVIPGWTNYEASNFGRVRNLKGQILKPQIHYGKDPNIPYLRVMLTKRTKQGRLLRKNMRVHRAVALAFHGRPSEQKRREVDHKNAITYDNRADNLEWVTSQENIRRKLRTVNT